MGFGLGRPDTLRAFEHAAAQSLGYRLVELDAMQAIRLAPFSHLLNEFIERIVDAVVRRNDRYGASPNQKRHRCLNQLTQFTVESSLVDDDAPLFAAQVGWPGRQRGDACATGEADAKREDVLLLILDDDLLHLLGGYLEVLGPECAIKDEFLGHVLVVADVPGVLAALARCLECALGRFCP